MGARNSIGLLTLEALLVLGCADDPAAPKVAPALEGTITIGQAPVVGAVVTASSGVVSHRTRTADDGTYGFSDLPSGVWGVEAVASGIACDERDVTVGDGENVEADLDCRATYDFPGGPGIYIADADGSGATWLTRGDRPDWSPDGRRLAFDRDGSIHVVDADGSDETELVQGVDPSWSPDGGRIAFAGDACREEGCGTEEAGIYVVGSDGSGLRPLTPLPYDYWFGPPAEPDWSPDGETIAYTESYRDGDRRLGTIYLMSAGGGARRWLWPEVDARSDPHWTSDGSRIVFWSQRAGIASVHPDDSFNSGYRNFPFFSYGAKPEPSPDGDRLLFTANRHHGNGPFLYLMGPQGPRLLVPLAYDATWSPDGSRIAFVHGDGP